MTKHWRNWVLAAVVFAGVAGATASQVIPTYDSWLFKNTTEFTQTVTIDNPPNGNALNVAGPASFTSTVTNTGAQVIDAGLFVKSLTVGIGAQPIAYSCSGTGIYDMPTLFGDGIGQGCAQTNAIGCDGGTFGDTCSVGVDQVVTSPTASGVTMQGRFVYRGAVKVEVCLANQLDGGTGLNIPDASYTVRCFR